jgi:hypothetical protein
MLHAGPLLVPLAAVAAFAAACSSSSSSSPPPAAPPAPPATPATFSDVYTQVVAKSCTPCHTAAGQEGIKFGMLDMTSQAAAYSNLVNVAGAGDQCGGKGTRVVPGKPDSSIFYLKISLDDPTPCGAKMPLGMPAVTQEQADLVESWINAGAPNN